MRKGHEEALGATAEGRDPEEDDKRFFAMSSGCLPPAFHLGGRLVRREGTLLTIDFGGTSSKVHQGFVSQFDKKFPDDARNFIKARSSEWL